MEEQREHRTLNQKQEPLQRSILRKTNPFQPQTLGGRADRTALLSARGRSPVMRTGHHYF
jgi:hypothetical protein